MIKKILSWLMVICLILSYIPTAAFAADSYNVSEMSDEEILELCIRLGEQGDQAALDAIAAAIGEERIAKIEAMYAAMEGNEPAVIAETTATVTVYKQVDAVTDKVVDLKYFEYVGTATDLEDAVTKLNNAGANGGLIEISEGTLVVTNRQDITLDNVIIKGAGKTTTTITGDTSKFNNSTDGCGKLWGDPKSEYKTLLGLPAENLKVMDLTIDGGDCGGYLRSKDFKTVRVNSGVAYLENIVIKGNRSRSNLMIGTSDSKSTVYANKAEIAEASAVYGAVDAANGTLITVNSILGGTVVGSVDNLGAGYYKLSYNGLVAYTTIPYAIETYNSGDFGGLMTAAFVAENAEQGVSVAQAMTNDLVSGKLLYGKNCAEMRTLAAQFRTALAGLSADTKVDVQDCLDALDAALAIANWHSGNRGICEKCGASVPVVNVPAVEEIQPEQATEEEKEVIQEVITEVAGNTAVQKEPVALPEEVKEIEIVLKEVKTATENNATVAAKLTFNVVPKNATGEKVPNTSAEITFRLPIPAAWNVDYAKVTHDGTLMGIYAIQVEGDAKYVEIVSANFSEFAVEPTDETPAPTVVEVATLDALLVALADNSKDLPIVITAQIVIPAGMTVELDLNGKTVNSVFNGSSTTNHIYALSNKGTLTITDSVGGGSINSRGIYNYGTLILNGGAINAIDGNGGYAVNNETGSTFIMNGGIVAANYEDDHLGTQGGHDATALDVPAGCTATLNGGKVVSVTDFTYAIAASGTLIIPADSTVEVIGAHGAIAVQGGTTTISGGQIICSGVTGQTDNVIYISSGKLEITGGSITHKGQNVNADSGAGVVVSGSSATVAISGGSITGLNGALSGNANTTITGGTFIHGAYGTNHYSDVSAYVPEGYEYNAENGTVVEAKTYVAQIGEQKFETLKEALAAVQEGETIELLPNVVIDLGGVGMKLPLVMTNVTIKGAESHTSVIKNGHLIQNDSNFNISGLTFEGVVFEDAYIVLTPWDGNSVVADITVNNCIFRDLNDADTMAPVHITQYGVKNLTFTNNVVKKLTGGNKSGLYVNATGNVIITGNVFDNIQFRPALVKLLDCDGIADAFVFENNKVSNTTRLQVYGTEEGPDEGPWTPAGTDVLTVSITGNTFANISSSHIICTWGINGEADISKNYYDTDPAGRIYWNNELPSDVAGMVGLGIYPYYTELNADGTINTDSLVEAPELKVYVAQIGEQKFETLQEAIAAAVEGDTIVLLADIELTADLTIEKSVTIDGNGHKLIPADTSKTYNSAIMAGNSGWGDDHGETITLKNIVFEGWSTNYGVVRAQGVTLIMDNCEFNNNAVAHYAYGVLSLNYTDATVTNSKFVGNTSRAIDINYNGDGSNAIVTIDGCTFEDNTSTGAGIVVRNNGDQLIVKNSVFKNNTVNTNGNAATLYAGWGEEDEVSGCTFEGNTVITSHATTKRFASAIFADGCTITGNVFGDNSAIRNGETITTIVAVGAYYGAADVSGNYWGGNAPVPGVDYTVEYTRNDVAAEDYFADAELTEEIKLNNVAKVGKYYYTSLQAAIEAAQAGETVKLLADISLTETLTIAADKDIVLDLAGKILSYASAEAKASAVINNEGKLTVVDTIGGGKITTSALNPDLVNKMPHYANNTINNRGELIIDSGKIENTTNGVACYAIDNYSGSTLTVNDGEIVSVYSDAIRLFGANTATAVTVTINGGTVGSIWAQDASDGKKDTCYALTVNGGTVGAIYVEPTYGAEVAINGGEIEKVVIYDPENGTKQNSLYGIVSGGTFKAAMDEKLVADGFELVENENGTFGVQEAKNYVAQIGEQKFETVAAALAYAKDQGMTDVVITLIGETTSATTDSFDLVYTTLFNSVTFKQEDPTKTYYLYDLYTGVRTNGGKFVFDGVNITVTDQYMLEGKVELINNSVIYSTAEANCFLYYAEVTVEPGSKLYGVIEDFRGGDMIIDGGKTDGSYNTVPDFQDAILVINWSGDKLVLKNGAYAKINAANEVGRLTINAGAAVEMFASKLEAVEYITVSGTLQLDLKSLVSTKKITGAGKIIVDVSGFNGEAIQLITADMTGFTGTVELINSNNYVDYELSSTGLTIEKKTLAGSGTEEDPYLISTLEDLILFRDSVNAGNSYKGEVVKVTADIDLGGEAWTPIGASSAPFKGTFDGGNFTVSNLVVSGTNNIGFFGYADGCSIKNLKIKNATVTGADCVGAIAGQVYSTSTIDNCHVSGSIKIEGQTNVGGIVGKYYVKVSNCSVIGDGAETSYIKGTYVKSDFEGDNVGGIMGHGGESNNFVGNTVKNITISGTRKVGGIVGTTNRSTNLNGCVVENVVIKTTATAEYAAGNTSSMDLGGLIGHYYNSGNGGKIENVTVSGVAFETNGLADAGAIVGGDRSTPNAAPVGVTASNVTISNVTGATQKYLIPAVAKIGEETYATLAEAIAAANGGEVEILCNVEENLASIENVTFTTNVVGGVTVINTCADWVNVTNVTIGSGVTMEIANAYFTGAGVNYIEGTLKAGTLYNANNSKTTVKNGGKIITTGMIVNRYHTDANAGIYVYGDGNNTTVEISCGDTIGTYSGTFYAKDAVVEGNMLWIDYLKGSTQEADKYAQSTPIFENSVVNITKELRLYKDATLTLNNTIVTAGTVQIRENATPTVTMDNSSIKANSILNLAGATLNAVLGEDGTVTFKTLVAKIGDNYYATLADAIAAAQADDTIKLLADVTTSTTINVTKNLTIDGNGKTITYTGAGYAINAETAGTSLTVKNLTIDCTEKYNERGINFNTQETLTLEKVTIKGNVNYAINLRAGTKNCTVNITDCNITGNIALNVWGANSTITATNTNFVSEYYHEVEACAVIKFNNDGSNAAHYAKFTMNGGSIISVAETVALEVVSAYNEIDVSDETVIKGAIVEAVAAIMYENNIGQFYTAPTLQQAIDKAIATNGYVVLLKDVTASSIITINSSVVIDGNGHKLTSTAGRAINIDTTGKVAISNLIINAGERAINIINKASTVELNNVTATAKNNAVMIATSAGAVKLTINDSDLTGLAVVNVAGANAQVEIKNTKITNVDASSAEQYGAITVWSSAAGADVVVNGGSTITVADDSRKAYVFPGDAEVYGVDDVGYIVATIGDAGFETLASAINKAKAGDTITLLRDVTLSDILVIDKAITLDGNGKKLTSTAGRAINVSGADGVTIKNLTIDAKGERAINVIQGATNLTLDNVTATAANYAVNVAGSAANAEVTIKNSNLTGLSVVNVAAAQANIEIIDTVITNKDASEAENYGAITVGTDATNAVVTVSGGEIIVSDDSVKAIIIGQGATVTGIDDVHYVVALINGGGFESLQSAIDYAVEKGGIIEMIRDVSASEIITITGNVTINGNGHTLTSTAGRAINIETTGKVVINNLTINAGERAINIINKASTVELNNVTATATNNAVMIATSAGAVKLTINDSDLTGLAVVNVAGAGSEVVIDNTNITNVDASSAEQYGAITVWSSAAGADVTVTGGNITVADDSRKAYVFPGDAEVYGVDDVGYIVATIGDAGFETLASAINKAKAGDTIKLLRDVTASEIITIDKAITLDGNGKTLTSTAGRAINVSGANGVTIKNLTIDAKGERAINVIGNATNVTIDNVTATAANYTVNVAASAPNAVVTINGSTLNGLCTVNVAAAGAKVTVDNSTVNCNDNNTTAGESYAALCLNKAAVGGSIIATNTTVNVTAGSDSEKGRNGAENGTVIINGSTEGVTVTVAVITYPGSDNYYGFTSLAAAIEFAKAGDTITLLADVTDTVTVSKLLTIVKNGHTAAITAGKGYTVEETEEAYIVSEKAAVELAVTGRSLLLEDIVQIKYYFGFDPAIKEQITASGMYVWNNAADAEALNTAAAVWHATEARDEGLYQGNHEYSFRSNGIPAKELGDLQYVVGYIVVDGETYYTAVETFSAKTWCEKKKEDAKEKEIAAALMNYGAAAQIYFGYKTEELMNVGFDSFTFTVDQLKTTSRVKGSGVNGFEENGISMVLSGAVEYKIYYKAAGLVGKSGFGIEYQVGDGEVHTVEGFELSANGTEYSVKVLDIPAKNLDEVVTIKPFYTENGERVYGAESTFCAEVWIYTKMTSTKTDAQTLADQKFAPALANYIFYANKRFSN